MFTFSGDMYLTVSVATVSESSDHSYEVRYSMDAK